MSILSSSGKCKLPPPVSLSSHMPLHPSTYRSSLPQSHFLSSFIAGVVQL